MERSVVDNTGTGGDWYEVLGVDPESSIEEITEAYRVLVRQHAGDKDRFEEITEAYMGLADPNARRDHDARRRPKPPSAPPAPDAAAPVRAPAATGGARCSCCGAENPRGKHYCGECGFLLGPSEAADAPKLGIARLVLPDPEPALTFESGEFVVGRDQGCAAVLPRDPYVSHRHAAFRGEMGLFSVEDLGSKNGVLVNGERIPAGKPRKLSDGDVVVIGRTALKFEIR